MTTARGAGDKLTPAEYAHFNVFRIGGELQAGPTVKPQTDYRATLVSIAQTVRSMRSNYSAEEVYEAVLTMIDAALAKDEAT